MLLPECLLHYGEDEPFGHLPFRRFTIPQGVATAEVPEGWKLVVNGLVKDETSVTLNPGDTLRIRRIAVEKREPVSLTLVGGILVLRPVRFRAEGY